MFLVVQLYWKFEKSLRSLSQSYPQKNIYLRLRAFGSRIYNYIDAVLYSVSNMSQSQELLNCLQRQSVTSMSFL